MNTFKGKFPLNIPVCITYHGFLHGSFSNWGEYSAAGIITFITTSRIYLSLLASNNAYPLHQFAFEYNGGDCSLVRNAIYKVTILKKEDLPLFLGYIIVAKKLTDILKE